MRDSGGVEGCFDGSTTRRFISTHGTPFAILFWRVKSSGGADRVFFCFFCFFVCFERLKTLPSGAAADSTSCSNCMVLKAAFVGSIAVWVKGAIFGCFLVPAFFVVREARFTHPARCFLDRTLQNSASV